MFQITGLETNVNFLIDLASHPSFQAGDVHTGFIDQHLDSLFPPIEISEKTISQAIASIVTNERIAETQRAIEQDCLGTPFTACNGFRINSYLERGIDIETSGQKYNIVVKYVGSNYEIKINDGKYKPFSVKTVQDPNPNRFTLKLNLDGIESIFSAVIKDHIIDIFNEVGTKTTFATIYSNQLINILFCFQHGKTEIRKVLPKFLTEISSETAPTGSNKAVSPMPGICDKLMVKVGDRVEAGQPVAVIIAMKMEYVLKASMDGVVKSVSGKLGQSVTKGEVIVAFEEDEPEPKN